MDCVGIRYVYLVGRYWLGIGSDHLVFVSIVEKVFGRNAFGGYAFGEYVLGGKVMRSSVSFEKFGYEEALKRALR